MYEENVCDSFHMCLIGGNEVGWSFQGKCAEVHKDHMRYGMFFLAACKVFFLSLFLSNLITFVGVVISLLLGVC